MLRPAPALLCLVLSAFAASTAAQSGFTSASRPIEMTQFASPNTYNALPLEARRWYVAGILDAESASHPQLFETIRPCVKGHVLDELTAMVDKGLMTMNTSAMGSMAQNVHNAILLQCSKQS